MLKISLTPLQHPGEIYTLRSTKNTKSSVFAPSSAHIIYQHPTHGWPGHSVDLWPGGRPLRTIFWIVLPIRLITLDHRYEKHFSKIWWRSNLLSPHDLLVCYYCSNLVSPLYFFTQCFFICTFLQFIYGKSRFPQSSEAYDMTASRCIEAPRFAKIPSVPI